MPRQGARPAAICRSPRRSTTERVYEGFLGGPEEGRTFFHGHTFTGNPLACAAALASLDVFESERTLGRLQAKIRVLGELLAAVAELPEVAEVRSRGFMVGIDLGDHDPALRLGHRVALEARRRGAIIRPLGDVVVLMPPLTIAEARPAAPGRDRRRRDPGRVRLRPRRAAGQDLAQAAWRPDARGAHRRLAPSSRYPAKARSGYSS